ncbi:MULTISPECIES: fimbrial protein [Burkholderia]|uniref:Fimbrial protein n=2 Tax=Burkholderia anthina TaxID=179879 RepID=A0A6P2GE68_9BURK|nr:MULTISPECIES: fimbrial protein [Burkholderia]AXK61798.1 type 1 fimbrial protein [Burkholderia sp. IDO3]MBM2768258.1 type 1 fimbrial protein [Burkholderia anthina]PCD62953.1 fimbrial protein [Burkholderia sp. IDO3]VVU51586.1 Fimbrial protein [Burkholderia anthina]
MKAQVMGLMFMVAGISVAPAAFAEGTGKVTFNGKLIQETCKINAGDEDKVVTLPQISTQSLTAAGQTAGSTMFDISVSECPAGLNLVAAHFETAHMDPDTRNATNQAPTATAAGLVQVQLLDRDGTTPILLGSSGAPVAISGGAAKMSYGGQYFATGQTTPGDVMAVVNYTLAYQ